MGRLSRLARRRARRGFTLIEIMVASGVGAIAMVGAFAFARYQVEAYRTQGEVSGMQTSSSVVFEAIARDLRSSAYGSSFWVGATMDAFGGNLTVGPALAPRGIPSIRPMDTAGAGNAAAMTGSDALTILRIEGEATHIPTAGGGVRPIPDRFNANTQFTVADSRALNCANVDIDSDGNPDGIALVSDNVHRPEPASFLLALAPIGGGGLNGAIRFDDTFFGLDPNDADREVGPAIVPTGAGPGSSIVCARPVTYWVDAQARLRLWRASTASQGGVSTLGGTTYGTVPIDPARDAVLAEGVEDLQIAYLMSSAAGGIANRWVYSTGGPGFGDDSQLAEIRAVRVSAVIRTSRRDDRVVRFNFPAAIENRNTGGLNAQLGCADPLNCFDPRFGRKIVTFQSEIVNMRLWDRMSSPARTTAMIRSYLP